MHEIIALSLSKRKPQYPNPERIDPSTTKLTSLATSQFCLMATGSATPLNSTTTASKDRPSMSVSTLVSNSSAREQQAQPFCNSTVPP